MSAGSIMEIPPAGRRGSYAVEDALCVVVAPVVFPEVPVVLPVCLTVPVEPVIFPVSDAVVASAVLLGEAVWVALDASIVVLLLLSARTTSESSSGSHRGQTGQAAVKVERRRIIE